VSDFPFRQIRLTRPLLLSRSDLAQGEAAAYKKKELTGMLGKTSCKLYCASRPTGMEIQLNLTVAIFIYV
jgi:hypothetical protein